MGEITGITITEEIEEYRRKIALLDGDRKAYYENSQWTMQMNKDAIQKLRSKNKELRLDLAKKKAGDEKVIEDAFLERDPIRHCAMRGMSGKEAIAKLDQQVCESKKRLNAMRHQFKMKEKKLSGLQTEYNQMLKDSETISLADTGESDESRQLRVLENRLDKMNLKLNEAKKIKSTYDQILEHQKEERRSWPKQLDTLEQGIKQQNDELSELKVMYDDAQIARDTARAELSKLEQSVYEAKREREVQLAEYKKQAEEKKEHAEKVEKRLQRASLHQQDDMSQEQKLQLSGEEQEKKISTYEEAMSKIKDATGVSDIQEVVQRFLSQGDTQKHLEALKVTNEKTLVRLKEEKEKLQKEFESMKYSGEAKMSSGQRLLEEYEDKLKASEQKCKEAKLRQETTSRILVNIKAGVEHLSDKLQYLKAPKTQVPQTNLNPTNEEYILDLLGSCEQKLLKLMEELGGKDIQDIVKEMEDTDFRSSLESKLPAYNTRVKLPTVNERMTGFEEDDDSGDEDDHLSRNAIKRTSQQIVDAKNKKNKPRQKKNKKK